MARAPSKSTRSTVDSAGYKQIPGRFSYDDDAAKRNTDPYTARAQNGVFAGDAMQHNAMYCSSHPNHIHFFGNFFDPLYRCHARIK